MKTANLSGQEYTNDADLLFLKNAEDRGFAFRENDTTKHGLEILRNMIIWGAIRSKNGHPSPFPLHYVEVGNEQVGKRYGERFNTFYKAIKEKYPQIEIIASMGIAHIDKSTLNVIDKLDIADEHTYKSIYWPMIYNDWYDKYERKDWGMYIGEYACNGGVDKGNMMAALNDATSILMYERNSDLIKMTSSAPLLENVNTPNWNVNLIKFDCEKSFGRMPLK